MNKLQEVFTRLEPQINRIENGNIIIKISKRDSKVCLVDFGTEQTIDIEKKESPRQFENNVSGRNDQPEGK